MRKENLINKYFMKKRNNKKKTKQSNFAKLSIFQNQKYKFKKKCPLVRKRCSNS